MTVLDITFPEYETVFSDMFRVTSLSILKDYSPEEIAGLDVEKLTQRLEKSSKKLLGKKQAEDLKQKASNSFGLKYGLDAFSLELKLLLSEIEHLRAQVKLLDKRIKQLVLSQPTQLLSIPGISHKLAGTILGELVSFEKIQGDPRSLLAFAGMDPKIKQSGTYVGQTKMSKRGSPYLREAIYLASQVAYHTDPMFRRIYDKHKGQGKAHPVAISHVAKKMTYVIASVLRTGRKYQPEMNQGQS